MPLLTVEQTQQLRSLKRDYSSFGLDKRLFKPQTTSYRSTDELGATIESISPKIQASSLSLRGLIKRSGLVQVEEITVDDGETALVTMTLTMKITGRTIAIPRWSLYYPNSSTAANEIASPDGLASIENIVLYHSLRLEPVNDQEQRHVFVLSIQNNTGVNDVTFDFKGDWIYLGEVVGQQGAS